MTTDIDHSVTRPMLQMKDIGKSFGANAVLQDVQLDLLAGEVHIVAGENGAGKSTLINILGGVYTDYQGQILLNGKTVQFHSVPDAANHGIAVIHQELSLVDALSVVDNMFLGREICRCSWLQRHAMQAQARQWLSALDLDIDLACPVEHYPVGIKQMIEICKALSLQSRIIVMDEPTSALTEPEAQHLFHLIDTLKHRNVGIIYITHKMEEIYRIGDRITVLRDGRTIGTEQSQRLSRDRLVSWMVGRTIEEQFPDHATHTGEICLEVTNFTVPDPDLPEACLVDGVNLCVHAGEVVGVAGLQGSGNSALLNGLFGTYGKAVQGDVQVNGQTYREFAPARSIARGMALVTNDRKTTGLIGGMNIIENVTLAALKSFSRSGFLRPQAERRAVTQQASTLNLKGSSLDADVLRLSGGNQQKVVLAKWLETRPRILLLDDPCRGVDIGAKHEIYELINRLCAQGLAILLVSSEMSELLFMSDRIMVMHAGQVALEMDRAEATQEKILYAALGGKE